MNRVNWIFARAATNLPWLTLLNCLLLVATIVIAYCLLLPAQSRLVQRQLYQPEPVVTTQYEQEQPTVSGDASLQLPEVNDISQAVKQFFMLADDNGLYMQAITYKDEVRSNEQVMRYEIDFELNGNYLDIKSYLNDMLVAMPYLALQQLSFHREDKEQDTVNAAIKMSLFLNYD